MPDQTVSDPYADIDPFVGPWWPTTCPPAKSTCCPGRCRASGPPSPASTCSSPATTRPLGSSSRSTCSSSGARLLDPQARDRPAHHQLLDLLGALDVCA